ncbi:hypothetical protein PACTADRAFT_51238 [Pachysolen tannophilus NRRL Y-2460]|uniref:Mitochondrial aspartate-glutamate transporter AGC1 n=1 Tax=Pachysolen tannophilus NRRL Y-2460 TaxID=669874 RepID=A0A1E4TRK7_PACTA|nr:hypothetical protein PACTADRAFT_51238 [Pachysolen tannophilus NRRL Y-2460]
MTDQFTKNNNSDGSSLTQNRPSLTSLTLNRNFLKNKSIQSNIKNVNSNILTQIYFENSTIDARAEERLLNFKNFQKLFANNDGSIGLLYLIADRDRKGFLNLEDWLVFTKSFLDYNNNNTANKLVSELENDNKLMFKLFKILENDYYKPKVSNENYIDRQRFIEILKKINLGSINDTKQVPEDEKDEKIEIVSGIEKFLEENKEYLINDKIDFKLFQKLFQNLPIIKFNIEFDKKIDSNQNNKIISLEFFKKSIVNVFDNKLPIQLLNNIDQLVGSNKTLNYNEAVIIINFLKNLPKFNYLLMSNVFSQNQTTKSDSISLDDFLNYINKNSTEKAQLKEVELYFYWNWLILKKNGVTEANKKSVNKSNIISLLSNTTDTNVETDKAVKTSNRNNLYPIFHSLYSFVLGSAAGAFGATIVYPIDLVKTRMQAQRHFNKVYNGYLDCFYKVLKGEGFRGMYSGIVPQWVGVAPEKAIKLTVNDIVRKLGTDKNSGTIPLYWEILAGCSAGATQVIFTNPLEITKIRLQVQGEALQKLKTSSDAVTATTATTAIRKLTAWNIVKSLGFKGLYKGSFACILRDVPFSAIYFPTYANLKKYLFGFNPNEPRKIQNWQLLVSGALAGMPAAFLTTPSDVIKTRLQVETKKGETKYLNVRHAFKTILKEEGFKAFFRGGIARVCRSSPQFGFTLASYEIFQKYLPFDAIYDVSKNLNTDRSNNITCLTPEKVENFSVQSPNKYNVANVLNYYYYFGDSNAINNTQALQFISKNRIQNKHNTEAFLNEKLRLNSQKFLNHCFEFSGNFRKFNYFDYMKNVRTDTI